MSDRMRKFIETFIAMSTDCLLGGITVDTFIENAKIAIKLMEKEANHA